MKNIKFLLVLLLFFLVSSTVFSEIKNTGFNQFSSNDLNTIITKYNIILKLDDDLKDATSKVDEENDNVILNYKEIQLTTDKKDIAITEGLGILKLYHVIMIKHVTYNNLEFAKLIQKLGGTVYFENNLNNNKMLEWYNFYKDNYGISPNWSYFGN